MTLEAAHQEWDYQIFENRFTGRDSRVSIPCQLRFTEDPEQDTERFHKALDRHGFSPLDSNPDKYHRERGSTHYDGEVMIQEKYHRLRVLVFRGGLVRLFPHDDYVPTLDELSALIEAIEAGFDAPLEHSPIQRRDEAE